MQFADVTGRDGRHAAIKFVSPTSWPMFALLFLAAVAFSFAIPLCPARASHVVTQEDQFRAIGDYISCILNARASLDDGSSDLTAVAAAIEPRCAGQLSTLEQAMAATTDLASGQAIKTQLEQNQLQLIMGVVARARANPQAQIPQ